jgi:hypothetical protein
MRWKCEITKRDRQLRLFVPQAVNARWNPNSPGAERETQATPSLGTGLTIELACSALIDSGARHQPDAGRNHWRAFRLADYGRDWAAVRMKRNLDMDFVLVDELVSELGNVKSISDTLLALVRKAHGAGAAVIAPEVTACSAHTCCCALASTTVSVRRSHARSRTSFDFNRPLW